MKWLECEACGDEFRVVSETLAEICFCPFCGTEIEDEPKEDDEEYE